MRLSKGVPVFYVAILINTQNKLRVKADEKNNRLQL